MEKNLSILPKIIMDFLFRILYFPFWWYSFGFIKLFKWSKNFLSFKIKGLGLLVWLKNIFTPMYGQKDIAGFFISFFIRLIQIIFRGIIFLFFVFLIFIILLFWLLFPVFIVYQIFIQLNFLLKNG
jgi:hypothetical protein